MKDVNYWCSGCEFQRFGRCDYDIITGCVRPCPMGRQCDFRSIKGSNPARGRAQSAIEEQREADRHELYGRGMNDYEIAEITGFQAHTITSWRKRRGLLPNAQRGGIQTRKETVCKARLL